MQIQYTLKGKDVEAIIKDYLEEHCDNPLTTGKVDVEWEEHFCKDSTILTAFFDDDEVEDD